MQLNEVTEYEKKGRVAVVTVNSPPVNALSAPVRQGVAKGMDLAEADPEVAAVVLICAGRTFFPGADISEFDKPPLHPTLRELLVILENSEKPVIAATHGTVLGGGLELALAAHYRVAVPGTRLGLPEVNLGILPGAGGTQRLPRIVGVEKALEMIITGSQVSAAEAQSIGLLDSLFENDRLREGAIAFANRILDEKREPVKVRDRSEMIEKARGDPGIFDRFRKKNIKKFIGLLAPEYCLQALEAAISLPFEEGLKRERELFDILVADPQSAALRHVFFAERQAGKIDGVPGASPDILAIQKVGVVGAGTMGGGIAMNFLNAGIPVTIVDTSSEALERGLGIVRKNYQVSASKGKIRPEDVERLMRLLSPSTALDNLADADLVIEAVFENIAVKRDVFARLDKIARPDAILATNTSYLDIDEIAAATSRPSRVVGLHFFSPANVMKLVEIVRTGVTDTDVVVTAVHLTKAIAKIGVVVGNGFGFVGNRMLAARNCQADRLILEGATLQDVDRVLREFGFPMGHFEMRDLVGLDVGWERANSSSSNVREILNEMGRHGQKTGGGYYDYDQSRNPAPSPVAAEVIREFAARENAIQFPVSDDEIRDRILYAMVNEGARILEEGIAARASDIDIIWVTGYGWPRYRGGPMFWADQIGMRAVRDRLRALQAHHGDDFAVSPLIERLANQGKGFRDFAPGNEKV